MKTNLQNVRKAAGFKSADAFADYIHMSRSTYKNYEQGVRNLTIEKAWEFADVLNCSLDELAGRKFPAVDNETAIFAQRFNALPAEGRQAVKEMVDLQQYKSEALPNHSVSGVA